MPDDDDFLRHRPLVIRIAYDITGSWVDAEDIAQQAYLRWNGITATVDNPHAYLARIATNLALDAVEHRNRVGYVGPYLPEPVITGPGADEAVAEAAEIEVALMVLLGELTPLERAAFLLHDVFGFAFAEVAQMLDREPAAVRKLASRARTHVDQRPDQSADVDPGELASLTASFLAAAQKGDLADLQTRLTSDVLFVGDGGGKKRTTRRPVSGAEKVARLLVGITRNLSPNSRMDIIQANRRPALAIYEADVLDIVGWFAVDNGQVSKIYFVRNPDKLTRLRHAPATTVYAPET